MLRVSELPRDYAASFRGRYQTRTDDLFRVKEARYQLRQSPVTTILPYPEGVFRTLPRGATHERVPVLTSRENRLQSFTHTETVSNADVAQLVAHHLAKVRVASSSLVIRSS